MAQICRHYKINFLSCHRTYSNKSQYEHYQILRVSPKATRKEIKDAFIRRSKELHPDITGKKNHQAFVKLTEAYSSALKTFDQKPETRDYETAYSEAYNPYNKYNFQSKHYASGQFWNTFMKLPWSSKDLNKFYKSFSYKILICCAAMLTVSFIAQITFMQNAIREERGFVQSRRRYIVSD